MTPFSTEDTPSCFKTVLDDELDTIEASRNARVGLPYTAPAACPGRAVEEEKQTLWGRMVKAVTRWFKSPPEEPEPTPDLSEAFRKNLVGVAISGGGIRSATFSLGVLQAMAAKGLLKHIDYLSTVSGGGYIGSWLVSWIRRSAVEPKQNAAQEALNNVTTALSSKPARDGENAPCEPIHHLRRFSNYLTPNSSLLSADTWTMVAIWSRNTLLNMAIIVFGLTAVLLLPRIAGDLLKGASGSPVGIVELLAILPLAVAAVTIGSNLYLAGRGQQGGLGQRGVQLAVVMPLLIASSMLAWTMLQPASMFGEKWFLFPSGFFTVLFAGLAGAGGLMALPPAVRSQYTGSILGRVAGFALAVGASALAGIVTATLMHTVFIILGKIDLAWRMWATLCIGPPLALMVLSVGMIVLIGIMGHALTESAREWLGRLRGWSIIYTIGWLLITGIAIYGPFTLYWAGSAVSLSIGAIWAAVSGGGLFAGKSEKTAGQPKTGFGGSVFALDAVAKAAPFVFILGFATLIAFGIHEISSPSVKDGAAKQAQTVFTLATVPVPVTLTTGEKARPLSHFELRRDHYADTDLAMSEIGRFSLAPIDFSMLGSLLALAAAGCLLLSWRVDINDFSMHHFYRNRLIRCYLRASRPAEGESRTRPNAFTDFCNDDDPRLRTLARPDGNRASFAQTEYCGPYPIINGTLNLAGESALAWQERKAASFIFTPLYCGYDKPRIDTEAGQKRCRPRLFQYGYIPTRRCSGADGISIGTAMGISGAAANPNAGYHTSSAVAFLMTLFNVRLGWWLGNPARLGKGDNHGPAFGLTYLITELFGLASANKAYVNVSDGGHFENLGLYELVKRRCRYIIAIDGEQDGEMKFEGLANAIRKCRTDFGVEIDINVDKLRLKDGFSRAHCAMGTIRYPEGDGQLLYLKASLIGSEGTDILQYHSTHDAFPHQSTGDQWFDESQFESYRKLGTTIAKSAFDDTGEPLADAYATPEAYSAAKTALFERLRNKHCPPEESMQKRFTTHAEGLSRLVEAVAKGGASTACLDPVIFDQWDKVPFGETVPREARYLCTSFLQLMENVFLDLNLGDPAQQANPDNAGWMKLFRSWAASDAFKHAWEMAGSTYGTRFQDFYRSLTEETRTAAASGAQA